MRVVISGSTGLLGTALVAALRDGGSEVVRLVRRPPRADDERQWDPADSRLDPSVLAGAAAVVNLSGAPVGGRRWNAAYKQEIRDSRVDPTATIALALAALDERRPPLLLNASAIGWYGELGETTADESAPAGSGYFPAVVRDWEAATAPAAAAGVRVLLLRTGLVLTGSGGLLGSGVALPFGIELPLLRLFRWGLGGRLGNGQQWQSWISLEDEVRAIVFLLENADALGLSGPINLTGPAPVRNCELTTALARAVRRPAVLPVPRLGLRVGVGEFAGEALASQRVLPSVLEKAGFAFRHSTVDSALAAATQSGR